MELKISKVSVNIGVGDSTDRLQKAEKLLQDLLEQKPVRTYARATIPDFNVKKHSPIGLKVTLRKKKANEFLKKAFEAVENEIKKGQFDSHGNLSFGIKEYIELPDTKYDPDIGMFGMDVSVNVERPGYRISRRKKMSRKIHSKVMITPEESMKFFQEKFKIKVV